MRNRQPGMPYTELYFRFKVLREVSRVIGIAGAIVVAVVYFILANLFPGAAPQIAVTIFLLLVGAFVLCVVWGICRIFAKPRTAAEIEKSLGWAPNPPRGESWFRLDGTKKQYDRATGTWS